MGRYGPVVCALVFGLAGTGALFGFLWRNAQRSDQKRFDTLTHFLRERLDDRVEKYEQVVVLAREFFIQNAAPSQAQWRQLLDRLKLPLNYSGLMGLGYGFFLPAEPSPGAESEWTARAAAEFPRPPNLPPDASFAPLRYAYAKPPFPEPSLGTNFLEGAVGYSASMAEYRNALYITGCLAPGAPGNLFHAHGFYMVHTVYDAGLPVEVPRRPGETYPETWARQLKERLPHRQGHLIAAIDVDELLKDLLEGSALEAAFEIFDHTDASQGRRLNDRVGLPDASDRLRRTDLRNRTLEWPMYANRWSIVFYPTAEFERRSPRRVAWIALGAGLAITLCISGLVWLELSRRLALESHARQLQEARDLIRALSREREQTSRDLHDGVLQSLYALGLGLQKTRRTIARDPVLAEERCRQNLDALELAMAEVRRYLGKGGSEATEDLELETALGNLAEVMHRQGRVPVCFDLKPGPQPRPQPGLVLQLLQIAREAIANAQRHSGADFVVLSLSADGEGLVMRIEDNGRGFEASDAPGHGLRNMAARAGDMGAEFRLDTRLGGGARVTVKLPPARCLTADARREAATQPAI